MRKNRLVNIFLITLFTFSAAGCAKKTGSSISNKAPKGPPPTTKSITIAWDPNPETDIAGYRVYYGLASRDYVEVVDAGPVTQVTFDVPNTALYFTATAYNTSGLESEFSVELIVDMTQESVDGIARF